MLISKAGRTILFRSNCPVCLGAKMYKLKLETKGDLLLDFCKRCGGIWFDYGEVKQLRSLGSKILFNKIVINKSAHRMQCHSCHTFIDRNATE